MKKTLALVAVVLTLGMGVALDAEARRLGGAKSGGMQRQNVTAPAHAPGGQAGAPLQASPAAGAPAAAAAGTAAAAGKRSWMGPIAGLAAGIGLMALASHLGFGEAMANMMMIGLLVMVGLAVVGFVMRRKAGPAMAGAGAPMARQGASAGGSLIGSRIGSGLAAPATDVTPSRIPADFDTAGFERNAQAQFLALQEANDARDVARLRGYLTPEMFALVQAEIAERGDVPQKTEVFGLDARVLEVVEEATQYIVSVRFTGGVREQAGPVESLDEVWHLTKPRTGAGGWLIAGIQQVEAQG